MEMVPDSLGDTTGPNIPIGQIQPSGSFKSIGYQITLEDDIQQPVFK